MVIVPSSKAPARAATSISVRTAAKNTALQLYEPRPSVSARDRDARGESQDPTQRDRRRAAPHAADQDLQLYGSVWGAIYVITDPLTTH